MGVAFGISTMAAAALGNAVSDVAGIGECLTALDAVRLLLPSSPGALSVQVTPPLLLLAVLGHLECRTPSFACHSLLILLPSRHDAVSPAQCFSPTVSDDSSQHDLEGESLRERQMSISCGPELCIDEGTIMIC